MERSRRKSTICEMTRSHIDGKTDLAFAKPLLHFPPASLLGSPQRTAWHSWPCTCLALQGGDRKSRVETEMPGWDNGLHVALYRHNWYLDQKKTWVVFLSNSNWRRKIKTMTCSWTSSETVPFFSLKRPLIFLYLKNSVYTMVIDL
jgi:hypothetical protein